MFVWSVRTLYIQLIRGVDKNIVATFPVKGKRGAIYDRNGRKMAYDVKVSDIVLKDCRTKNAYEIALFMNRNFNLEIDRTVERISSEGAGSLKLLSNANRNRINQVLDEINQIEELEVGVEREGRYYPQNNLASHVIGNLRGDREGWGAERDLNDFLKAKTDSLSHFILNSGKRIPAYNKSDYEILSGRDIILTIDIDYQKILSEELLKQLKLTNSEYANGIIVDPFSGEILAMVTLPSPDLNKPLKTSELTRNRTINHSEEPGSTIKTFSIIAGLDNDIIDLSEKVYCEAGDKVGEEVSYLFPEIGREIKDHEGRDTISVKDVLAYSSNIGTVRLSLKIGKAPIYNTLKKFGFGGRTGIDFLKEENKGIIRPFEDWDNYSWSSIPIGQEMRSNNLQLAMAYSAIANGGYLVEPKLIKEISNYSIENSPAIIRRVAKQETIVEIVKALKSVVEKGTASKHKADYCFYGKTGTAQVYVQAEDFYDLNGDDEYSLDVDDFKLDIHDTDGNGEWSKGGYSNSIYMPSFAGVFPCDNPQIVCIISFFNPDTNINSNYKWASITAVPVAQEVFRRLKLKDKDLVL